MKFLYSIRKIWLPYISFFYFYFIIIFFKLKKWISSLSDIISAKTFNEKKNIILEEKNYFHSLACNMHLRNLLDQRFPLHTLKILALFRLLLIFCELDAKKLAWGNGGKTANCANLFSIGVTVKPNPTFYIHMATALSSVTKLPDCVGVRSK